MGRAKTATTGHRTSQRYVELNDLLAKPLPYIPHRHVRDMAVPADLSGRREPLRDSRMRPGRIHFSETLRAPFGGQTTGVSPSFFSAYFSSPCRWSVKNTSGGLFFTAIFQARCPLSFSPAWGYGPLARVLGHEPEGGKEAGGPPLFGARASLDPLAIFHRGGRRAALPRGGRSLLNDPCRKARIPEA